MGDYWRAKMADVKRDQTKVNKYQEKELESLIDQMNLSQQKMYQRLTEILPVSNSVEIYIIKKLTALHLLGFVEEQRTRHLLTQLGILDSDGC
jgi:hypothetical protein